MSFRYPLSDSSRLLDEYAAVAGTQWQEASARPDYDVCEELVRRYVPSGDLLDVGCHTGEFAARFTGSHALYGLEPMPDAAQVARSRNIHLLGADYIDVASCPRQFDVITAIDVIEHLTNPGDFVALAARRLRPGGALVIATGNSDSRLWRWLGSKYWYCTYAEHICFVSPRWAQYVADRQGMQVRATQQFRRFPDIGAAKAVLDSVSLALYLILPSAWRAVQRRRQQDPAYPPAWRLAQDHFAVVLTK